MLAAGATGWALGLALVGIGVVLLVAIVGSRDAAREDAWERQLRQAAQEAGWVDATLMKDPGSEDAQRRAESARAELERLASSAPDDLRAARARRLADALHGLDDPRSAQAHAGVREAIEAVEHAV